MDHYRGGGLGRTQFGICYMTNNATKDGFIQNYALFLDSAHKHEWDFQTNSQQFQVRTSSPTLRFYFIHGSDLKDLRSKYMRLTGAPPVPPKQTFGLWVSEYGYTNWTEVDTIVEDLQSKKFPLDGMVMDLQWFGGIVMTKPNSSMGHLAFDEMHFPNPKSKVQYYKDEKHISLCTIEESYIARGNPEYKMLASKGYLVRKLSNPRMPQNMTTAEGTNTWWGEGGMIDWTNTRGADYWHDLKRQKLMDMGIHVHWTGNSISLF
jgi:alpha-glucosidase